jgi:hypothetical protein
MSKHDEAAVDYDTAYHPGDLADDVDVDGLARQVDILARECRASFALILSKLDTMASRQLDVRDEVDRLGRDLVKHGERVAKLESAAARRIKKRK